MTVVRLQSFLSAEKKAYLVYRHLLDAIKSTRKIALYSELPPNYKDEVQLCKYSNWWLSCTRLQKFLHIGQEEAVSFNNEQERAVQHVELATFS